MQRPNEANRREIMAVAAKLFARRPYHEVRLDDVAAAARIGKGTLYVYFRSKEDLYLTLIREGFASIVASLNERQAEEDLSSWDRLGILVDGLVAFATRFPHVFQLLRAGILPAQDAELQRHRRELSRVIEQTIRDGVAAREIDDPQPRLTAQFVVSFVRGAILYGPRVNARVLRDHLLHVLRSGIQRSTTQPRRSRTKRGAP